MDKLILVLVLAICGVRSKINEPHCTSYFDYEEKLLYKLVKMEEDFKGFKRFIEILENSQQQRNREQQQAFETTLSEFKTAADMQLEDLQNKSKEVLTDLAEKFQATGDKLMAEITAKSSEVMTDLAEKIQTSGHKRLEDINAKSNDVMTDLAEKIQALGNKRIADIQTKVNVALTDVDVAMINLTYASEKFRAAGDKTLNDIKAKSNEVMTDLVEKMQASGDKQMVDIQTKSNDALADLLETIQTTGNANSTKVLTELSTKIQVSGDKQLADIQANSDKVIMDISETIQAAGDKQLGEIKAESNKVLTDLMEKLTKDHAIGFTMKAPKNSPTSGQLTFGEVVSNVGGGYDTATGIFTCTIPGYYIFSASLLKDFNYEGAAYCDINKNSKYIVGAIIQPDHSQQKGYFTAVNSMYVHLDAGDTVTLATCSPITSFHGLSSFSGFLTQADDA